MKYYAFKLMTGTVWVKPYSKTSKRDIEVLYASTTVLDVVEDIEADTEAQARKKAEKELTANV